MLTKESKQIIDELKQKVNKKELFNNIHLKKLFRYFESVSFNYEEPQTKLSKGVFPTSQFMNQRLSKKAKSYNYITSTVWLVNSRFPVDCTLHLYSKKESISNSTLNLLIYAISFIASLTDKPRQIKIHLILLPDKKLYKEKFTKEYINSGSCTFNDTESNIYVWRLEECIKVLFHECIHALRFPPLEDNKELIDLYQKRYTIRSTNLNIDETYTEIWAKIINCYFISKLFHLEDSNKNPFDSFCSLLGIEREFCFHQASKINHYLKQQKEPIDINKDTNVTAYYLGTAEIFHNFDHFLKMISKYSDPFYLPGEKFKNFLVGCKSIPRRKVNTHSKVYKTLRMTGIELDIRS